MSLRARANTYLPYLAGAQATTCQYFLAVTSRHHMQKTGLMALSQSLSRYKRAGESLFQLLSRFLAGDMADHDSTRQRPSKKLMGCHHHQGFCDVCASLQNHQGQPPHLAHTKAPIVPALDPGSSSLRISFLHLSQPKVLGWAPRTKIKNRGNEKRRKFTGELVGRRVYKCLQRSCIA